MNQAGKGAEKSANSNKGKPNKQQPNASKTTSSEGGGGNAPNITTAKQVHPPRRTRTFVSSVSSSPAVDSSKAANPHTPTKHSSVSSEKQANTAGSRLSESNDKNKNGQPDQVVPQLEEITQLLKNCIFPQKQQPTQNEGGGNTNRPHPKQVDREIRFEPPWETKIGQMQQVVRITRRHADIMLENRGSVIIRCYPYKSATYMHLVYNLIYATLASDQQFGPMQSPTEIRPILLHYDDDGIPNPVQHSAAPFTTIPQFGQQPNWTDVVLVRVRFAQQEPSLCFLQNFNRSIGRVFDRRQYRTPFAHPDLTQPERILRHRLQQICLEKNGGINPRGPRNRQYSTYSHGQNDVRYFHNGIQIYKEYPNGRTEPLQFENYTELQYLHVVVASLRKYATMYKQKELSVILQNIEQEELSEADTERITALVYSVVTTDVYRQHCLALQERNKANASDPPTPNPNGSSNPPNTTEFLPAHIERMVRRRKGPEKPQQNEKDKNENGSQGSGDKKESPNGGGEEETEKKPGERPPLVRIQFRSKEAASAFCQLFKECQQNERQKMMAFEGQHEDHDSVDSYSDLSDMDVFSDADGIEGGEEEGANKKKHKKGRKPKMNLYFPNAFAHRDLTPPELALGYALRQFCREKNGAFTASTSTASAGPSTSNITTSNSSNKGEEWKHRRFYTRAGRIFERSVNNNTEGQQQHA